MTHAQTTEDLEELRTDAGRALVVGLFGMGIAGLHAAGRPREAYGLALAGAGLAAIESAVRLVIASQRLAAARQAALPAPAISGLASCPYYRPGTVIRSLPRNRG